MRNQLSYTSEDTGHLLNITYMPSNARYTEVKQSSWKDDSNYIKTNTCL